jgi:hypothetical protein
MGLTRSTTVDMSMDGFMARVTIATIGVFASRVVSFETGDAYSAFTTLRSSA